MSWAAQAHPLDPLTADEIQNAVAVLKARPDFPADVLFSTVQLKEPPKSEVWNYRDGAEHRREAFAVVMDRKLNRTYESVIDLKTKRAISWQEIKGVQPLLADSEYEAMRKIVKADPRWRAAMQKRGFKEADFGKIEIDGWAVGVVDPKFSGRLIRGVPYFKGDGENHYGRPIEGVVALVDLNRRKVIDLIDSGVVPVAAKTQDFSEAAVGPQRRPPPPLLITQPEGAGYTLKGHEIAWQKWHFRYSMHPREGMVLHTVSYDDQGKSRPILYRAAVSEMVVPYGDPSVNWRWRAAFDVGEYNIGRNCYSLEKDRDAPPNAQLLDAAFADDTGAVVERRGIVAIYERDAGILWKHYDGVGQKNETRRARELVLSSVATIGNYDYAINYIFKQDGSMEVDLALTGLMLAKGVKEQKADGHHDSGSGHLVAQNIVAPHHQHFFNFRLDFDVDGVNNSVAEMNSRAMAPGAENPYGNGFLMHESLLKTEREAARHVDMQAARTWLVKNPSVRNSLGQNTGFIIAPGTNAIPYAAPQAPVRQRAGFIGRHFWATRYRPEEAYAAGPYPNQNRAAGGLPVYIADNEALENTDVVVWYTLGVTHIPGPRNGR
ncbi:primary-amine oxidase [Xylophilus rhododendri]|nr:primary-amine oxidase [Xylophilus rhododendri]